MDSARSSFLRNTLALLVAFGLGVLIANPAGFVWRVRYWIPAGGRAEALDKLVEAESGGAESELANALDSDDAGLRLAAAVHIAARGDKQGLKVLVALVDAGHPGAREELESLLLDSSSLDNYPTAQEWYDTMQIVIHYQPAANWSGSSVN